LCKIPQYLVDGNKLVVWGIIPNYWAFETKSEKNMPNDTVRASATALPKSRRAALGLFASASVLAVTPAVAQVASLEVDPIFAAIKRHHEAWRAFGATCRRTDSVVARNEGREVTEADEAAWTAANDAEEEVFEALITLSPVTIPGLRAAVHYFIEFETECIPGATDKFLSALLASPLLSIGRA
jgi:hypothetical protein